MATKTKTAEPTARALNTTAAQRIARVWIAGDAEYAQSGGMLARKIAEEASKVMPKEAQPIKADAQEVIALVAKARKWGKGSIAVRESQCMAILSARAKLPAAITAITEKYRACSYVDAYNAACAIRDGKAPLAAVTKKRNARSDGPADAKAAKKAAYMSLKRASELAHLPRAWKAAILATMSELKDAK